MTNRTIADFAAEATDDPWTLTLPDGRVLQPRPRSHYTYAEQQAEADLNMAWAQRLMTYERGELPTGEAPESAFMFGLKVRFSDPGVYIETKGTRGSGKNAKSTIPDFDALWSVAGNKIPVGEPSIAADLEAKPPVPARPATGLHKLIADIDQHYVPADPATVTARAAAAADPQGDAAGKSPGGETSSTATDANSNGTSPTSASISSTSGEDDTAGASSTP